jgi:hypothetical protein
MQPAKWSVGEASTEDWGCEVLAGPACHTVERCIWMMISREDLNPVPLCSSKIPHMIELLFIQREATMKLPKLWASLVM